MLSILVGTMLGGWCFKTLWCRVVLRATPVYRRRLYRERIIGTAPTLASALCVI